MISEDEISKVKDRLARATPGPWISYLENPDNCVGSDFIRTGGEDIYLTGATASDHEFIAHARQDIQRLIEEVERLKDLSIKK